MKAFDSKALYIIGNGFDLANGVRSSYWNFRDYAKTCGIDGRNLVDTMETYLHHPNLWGDFESALATIDRGELMTGVEAMSEAIMTTMDEDDDDFSYADYYASIDAGLEPVRAITEDLPRIFYKWLKTLKPLPPRWECPIELDSDARYIDFNYTEFLETLYGIPSENILYIHGRRGKGQDQIVLGHGEDPDDNYDRWWSSVKDTGEYRPSRHGKKGRRIKNRSLAYLQYGDGSIDEKAWRSNAQYHMAEEAGARIEGYFDDTRKKCDGIIQAHSGFFEGLKDIDRVVTIGHSLSAPDMSYYRKIMDINDDPPHIDWILGYYSDDAPIKRFVEDMGIDWRHVYPFCTKTDKRS